MTAAWDDGGGAGEGREEWKELREKEQAGVRRRRRRRGSRVDTLR